MLIDIPVLIAFDCTDMGRAYTHKRTFTMRFDVDKEDEPAQYATRYPPRATESWWADHTGLLFDLMPHGAYDKIVKDARRSPVDYCADEAEGERLQAEVDEQRAADGP